MIPNRVPPMTNAEIRSLMASVDPGSVRVRAGFTIETIAEACGTVFCQVWRWENRRRHPSGPAGARYARIIQGLARHLEIPDTCPPAPPRGTERR